MFCNDVDLLHWEPNLFREAAFASQLLASGTGDLAGAVFTANTGSFAAGRIGSGHVIALSGAVTGAYPIIAVESDTRLTLSVLHEGIGGAAAGPAVPVGAGVGLAYTIQGFGPQRRLVSELLVRSAGLEPEAAGGCARISNPGQLRRPCALGTLQMIYSALAAAAAEPAALSVRADLYERLYRRALRQVRLELDLDGDGVADSVRHLNVLEVVRA